jgi:hypothetical protein
MDRVDMSDRLRRTALEALGPALVAAVTVRAFGAPAALAADIKASQKVTSQPRHVKVRPRVPEFPPDVKALGERLLAAASPAVKSWSSQNAHTIAKGSGEPEALARAAVQSRWSHVRTAGASDTLTFLATYAAAKTLQEAMKQDLDSMSEMGETESLRLQMAQEQLAKMNATLLVLHKRISDADPSIIRNLK